MPTLLAMLSGAPMPAGDGRRLTADGESPLYVLFPLATGMVMACSLTYVRSISLRVPSVSFKAAPTLTSLVTSILPAVPTLTSGTSLTLGLQPLFFIAVVLNGVGLGAYNAACVLAPRYITGAEVALILLLETVFGPIFVFALFGDVPNVWTLASGGVLLTALGAHEIAGARSQPGTPRPEPTNEPVRHSFLIEEGVHYANSSRASRASRRDSRAHFSPAFHEPLHPAKEGA